jgi:hypothetical protein
MICPNLSSAPCIVSFCATSVHLTLSLTGVDPFDHTPLKMQNTLKVLKARYCQKLSIPQDVSQACFEITLLNLGLISL